MKNNAIIIMLLIVLTSFLASCNTDAMKPTFKTVENINIIEVNRKNITVEGDAVIYNPNPVSVDLKDLSVDVYVNDFKVGSVKQFKAATIAKKSEFSIPLSVSFKPKEMFADNWQGMLEAASGFLQNQSFDIRYEGKADFSASGIEFSVPILHEDKIKTNAK